MAEIWQRHKKYISVVGGGALAALVLSFALVWPAYAAAAKAREEATRIEKDVRALRESERFRDGRDIESLEAEIATLRALVSQVEKDVAFHGAEEFRLDPAEKDVLAAFAAKRDGTMNRLAAAASKQGAAFPDSLGFDHGDEPGRTPAADDIPRKMERLDLIDRASRLAIDCGVKRIESFAHGDGLDREIGPAARGDAFVARNCVRITAGGAFEPVLRFLHGMQQRGRYAAVMECALEKADSETDYVKATVTLASLHVDLEAKKPTEDEEEGPKKTRKPPRGTWR